VEEIVAEAIAKRGRVPRTGPLRRLLRLCLPSRGLAMAWREYRGRFDVGDLSGKRARWVWRALRANHRDFARLVRLGVGLEPGVEPEAASREILRTAAVFPESWSEQLVTLRTVQSLSVLDIRNYRRQVWSLGGYAD
jgi:hypothetical protein